MTGVAEPAWHRVADSDALGEDECRMVKAGASLLALVRTRQGYRAVDNTCPHRGGPLGQGTVEDGHLVCPWHGRCYDLETGACRDFEDKIATYPVEERPDGIYVAVAG